MNMREKYEQDQSRIIKDCYYMWNNYPEEKLKEILGKDYWMFKLLMEKLEEAK